MQYSPSGNKCSRQQRRANYQKIVLTSQIGSWDQGEDALSNWPHFHGTKPVPGEWGQGKRGKDQESGLDLWVAPVVTISDVA